MESIYCYTNNINGHQYVGRTNNVKRRQNEHYSNSINENSEEYELLFHKKLREYGKENFTFTILESGDWDNEETNNKEKFWIDKLKTYCGDGNGGYNLTRGGESHEHTRIYSPEIIKEIKNAIKQGISYYEINIKYHISISYLSALNNGLLYYDDSEKYPLHKYYQSDEEFYQIVYLLKETNIQMTEISNIVDKSYSTIKKINSGALHYNPCMSYPIRKVNSIDSKAKEVQKLLLEGKSNKTIIQQTGVSAVTIRRINSGETHYDSTLKYPLR